MIRVTVELVSAIHPSRNRLLGVAEIKNDGKGTVTAGHYNATFSMKQPMQGRTWRTGRVEGFKRRQFGAWDLLWLCLGAALGQDRTAKLQRSTLPAVETVAA